jgi:dTDP-4-dehydrorhamnose 3,5-epimerase
MPFTFTPLAIPEVIKVRPQLFGDARGFFLEAFKLSDFKAAGIDMPIIQSNHSRSSANVLRGLHYQKPPRAQKKLIRCVSGKIFDVAVDIRKDSPTFGAWVGEYLSEEDKNLLYIPDGFAHGFCVVSESAEIIYYCSDEYSPDDERTIQWNDPAIAIDWPVTDPVLSEKDARARLLSEQDL